MSSPVITNPTTYKQTTMQKLLGKNYKWWYVMVFNYKSAGAYVFSDFFYYLNQIISTYISIIIWSVSNRGDIADTINYLIFGNIFLSFTLLNNHWRLGTEVFSGKFSSKYILPIDLNKYYFFNAMSYMIKVSLVTIFYIPLIFYFKNSLQFNFANLGLLLLIYPISLVIKFLYNQLIGSSVFWITNSDGVLSFSETIATVFSGSLIPLSILNFKLLEYTPLSYLLHHPMQIYLGKYDFNQTLMVFAGGIGWCVVLYFLAKWIFKMGLKRNEAVGL